MKNHTKVYLKYFGYSGHEFMPCECCESRACDIHHIISRGMGGVKNNRHDVIENLQAVCRSCHDKYGDKKQHLEFLVRLHSKAIRKNFDEVMETLNSL